MATPEKWTLLYDQQVANTMIAMANKYERHSPLILGTLDVFCILGAYCATIELETPLTDTFLKGIISNLPYLIIFTLIWFGAAFERRLWRPNQIEGLVTYLTTVTKAAGDAAVFCVLVMVLLMRPIADREFLFYYCFGTLFTLLAMRVALQMILRQIRSAGFNLKRTAIVGANDRTAHLISVLSHHGPLSRHVEGILDDDPERLKVLEKFGLPHLGKIEDLEKILQEREIEEVYISLPVRSHYEAIQNIAHLCEGEGIRAHLIADLFPLRIATSRLMHLEDIPLLSLSTIPEAYAKVLLKRIIDIALSSALIALLSPMLITLAIWVKLDSRGPIIFQQERVGQNKRRFKMLKFRSMVQDAEKLRENLVDLNEADGPVFKISNDPRVTTLGRVMRKYSLDEFPQLFNVWCGEMSLVGPRPPIPAEVEEYTWNQRRRLSVKPGMTGLWQVSGRNQVGFQEWVEMDLEYIDNWSNFSDFLILLRTFKAVFAGRGAS